MKRTVRKSAFGAGPALLALLMLLAPGPATAQLTTANVSGTITDETGGPVPGATIIATNTETGFERTAGTGGNGNYALSGLTPGSYTVRVTSPNHAEQSRSLRVLVGQNLDVDFQLASAVAVTETVLVTAEQIVETKTSEVTTHVTEEQLDNLPQSNRNFLNFAALAPGLRIKTNEFDTRQEVASGALGASQTNVFIDGVSFKSDILQGGVIGQDASRGNPFPQNAVKEYQVLTQNFKAEYETAASAIISAVTKSGSNAFRGDAFLFYQDKDLVDENEFAEARRTGRTSGLEGAVIPPKDPRCPGGPASVCDKPEYERFQGGLAFGGPIVKEKAHFFLSYEGNRQDRATSVFLGSNRAFFGGNLPARFTEAEGNFTQPFRGTLFYGKLSYQPAASQSLELSGNIRHETDIRDFGAQRSFEVAENVQIDVGAAILKHQWAAASWLNQATLSYNHLQWNPAVLNFDLIGEEFINLLRLGGRDTEQDIMQDKFSLRDDLSYFLGNHSLKGGFVLSFAQYEVKKLFDGNPLFRFRSDISSTFPFEARYGVGDPSLGTDNTQLGIYIQDDWTPTPKLTLNLGLRWDYESDMLNNDHETPAGVRADLAGIVPDRYFTDGDDRDPYLEAFQPRVGVAYDFSGSGRTVAHAGYGIYYDRALYNDALGERFDLQYKRLLFRFSADGMPREGQPTVMWRPEYFSRAGLNGLIATGVGLPEGFLVDNNTEPLRSQQWSIGLRQALGPVVADVTYAGIRSENGFTFLRGDRNADGTCCSNLGLPNFRNVFLSSDDRKTWYDAIYVTLNKPFTSTSKWGATVAYAYAEAEQIGGDLFSLDFEFRNVADWRRYPTSTDERHHFVLSGLVGLPWGFRAGTLITLGSGVPYTIDDRSLGSGVNQQVFRRNAGRPVKEDFIIPDAFAFRTVDLRLEKDFTIGPGQLGLVAEVFNIFDYENFGDYERSIPTLPAVNANFGKPRNLVEPGRRLQFGLKYAF